MIIFKEAREISNYDNSLKFKHARKSFRQKYALLLRFCLQTLDYHKKKKIKRKVLIKEFKHVIRDIFSPSSYSPGYQNVSSFISRDKTIVRPNE